MVAEPSDPVAEQLAPVRAHRGLVLTLVVSFVAVCAIAISGRI